MGFSDDESYEKFVPVLEREREREKVSERERVMMTKTGNKTVWHEKVMWVNNKSND